MASTKATLSENTPYDITVSCPPYPVIPEKDSREWDFKRCYAISQTRKCELVTEKEENSDEEDYPLVIKMEPIVVPIEKERKRYSISWKVDHETEFDTTNDWVRRKWS